MNSLGWRKLLGGSGALFLVIGAFLAGRVHAGSDPALKTKTQTPRTQTQVQQQSTDQGYDDGTGASSATPDTNPPATQAS